MIEVIVFPIEADDVVAFTLVSGCLPAQTQWGDKENSSCVTFRVSSRLHQKYEGLHGPKYHPYAGYGHKLLPGERLSPRMTERQADALLRSDLRKLCAMFRGFGRDSLLLAAHAYKVGCGKVMKSRMYAKMRSGNRNIYRDYVDFKRWNGKTMPSIERRRKMEYLLLFTPYKRVCQNKIFSFMNFQFETSQLKRGGHNREIDMK